MFEIYTSIEGRKKTYIVSDSPEICSYAKKYFKVSVDKIVVSTGWILNEELYLENPNNKKAVKCWVAYWKA